MTRDPRAVGGALQTGKLGIFIIDASDPRHLDDLDRTVALLGPPEGRVMRAVWTRAVQQPFVVRDVLALMPELAYTTVMTTVRRLADKGLLTADAGRRPHEYHAAGDPQQFPAQASAGGVAIPLPLWRGRVGRLRGAVVRADSGAAPAS